MNNTYRPYNNATSYRESLRIDTTFYHADTRRKRVFIEAGIQELRDVIEDCFHHQGVLIVFPLRSRLLLSNVC